METDPPRHPRVSPTVKRWLGWGLTGVWLAGVALMLEVLHTGLWAPIALLVVVLLAELLFFRWNEGRWPDERELGKGDEPKAGSGAAADER